jgi:hypothetical protein
MMKAAVLCLAGEKPSADVSGTDNFSAFHRQRINAELNHKSRKSVDQQAADQREYQQR